MKAPFNSVWSAIETGINLITILSLVFWIYPAHVAKASALQTMGINSALVFNIEPKPNSEQQKDQNSVTLLNIDEVIKNDPLTIKLQAYLEQNDSPLAPFASQIVQLPQWQQALGITYVESGFCKYARNNNCGSYGVGPGHPLWRKYTTAFDGFKDLTTLLEKPLYKDRLTTCASKRGTFVVPGSNRWVSGCEKVVRDMTNLENEANQERIALASNHIVEAAANEVALVK